MPSSHLLRGPNLYNSLTTALALQPMAGVNDIPIIVRELQLAACRTSRVVLIEAPGGYGKTTLSAQIVDDGDLAAIRVQFTGATDIAAGVDVLQRAARRSGLGDMSEAIRAAAVIGPKDAFDVFLEFVARLGHGVVVVLDDVQHLDAQASAEFARVISDLPQQCRAIVAGRDLGLFARLGLVSFTTFAIADLQMGSQEAAAVLNQRPEATVVTEILHATAGWPAAIALAATRLRAEPTWSPNTPANSNTLLDALVLDMIRVVPELARLAALPLVDRHVAAIIGGQGFFESAIANGVLAARFSDWFAVPDPIRESMLRANAPEIVLEFDLATLADIARHYRDQGELRSAIALLRNATRSVTSSSDKQSALAAFLAALHWTELATLDANELVQILDKFDDSLLIEHPRLLITVAQAIELSLPTLRPAVLERAIDLAQQSGDDRTRRAANAEVARDLASSAQLETAMAMALAVLLESTGADEIEHITRARALTTVGRIEAFQCTAESLARGAAVYHEAAEIFREYGEHRWRAETLARRGYTTLHMAGFPNEGEVQLNAALALLPVGDATRAFWLTNYADTLDYIGRSVEGEAAAREAIEIGTRRHDRAAVCMGWWSVAWSAAHRGDVRAFRSATRQFENNSGPWVRPGQQVEFLASTAEYFAWLGDRDGYDTYAERARNLAETIDYLAPVLLCETTACAVWGDPQEAIEAFENLYPGVALVPSNRPTTLIFLALAHARAGHRDTAREVYQDALDEAAAMQVPDLLSRYTARVLKLLHEMIDTGAAQRSPESTFNVQLLGTFAVTASGVDRTPPPGHQSQVIKLLALNKALPTEVLIDAMWPDADLEAGRRRLRNLLNRIRQHADNLVVRDGDLLRLDDRVIIDLQTFERRAEAALAGRSEERIGSARMAISLYHGELLPADVYSDWAAAPRENAKRLCLSMLDLVADDAAVRGDTDEATRLLGQAISAEPLDEQRYIRICELLVRQGRTGSAREVAMRASVTLEEIGIEVGRELADLLTK